MLAVGHFAFRGVQRLLLEEHHGVVAADGRALARAVRVQGKVEPLFVEKVADLPAAILAAARDGDLVLVMGAGSIGNVSQHLASRVRSVNGAA